MKYLTGTILLFLMLGCNSKKTSTNIKSNAVIHKVETEEYLLNRPNVDITGTLILFGGYPESPEDIMREFEIGDLANENGIAVLYLKYNGRLWLEENEKEDLKSIIEQAFVINSLPVKNIYIGGFSSGGNITLLISNYLVATKSIVQPDGLFLIDSPVDLLEQYKCSKRNVEQNFNLGSVQESKNTISKFDQKFGDLSQSIHKYENYSPFTNKSKNIDNLILLNNLRIRMYTEPDTIWWKENRMNNYEDMNAFYIKELSLELQNRLNNTKVELIETKNKGYRKSGLRHPHSWSIVNKLELINWILNK